MSLDSLRIIANACPNASDEARVDMTYGQLREALDEIDHRHEWDKGSWCIHCGISAVAVVDGGYVRCLRRQLAPLIHSPALRAEREFTDALINAIGDISVAEAQQALIAWRTEHG